MKIVTVVPSSSKQDFIDHYESQGLTFERSDKIDRDLIQLTFSSDHSAGTQLISNDPYVEGFLEFEDGTSSKLYVRKNRVFDD